MNEHKNEFCKFDTYIRNYTIFSFEKLTLGLPLYMSIFSGTTPSGDRFRM